jgi:hypothetical protein
VSVEFDQENTSNFQVLHELKLKDLLASYARAEERLLKYPCHLQAERVREEMSEEEIIAARKSGVTFYTLCEDRSGLCPDTLSLGILTSHALEPRWDHNNTENAALKIQQTYGRPYYAADAMRVSAALFDRACEIARQTASTR